MWQQDRIGLNQGVQEKGVRRGVLKAIGIPRRRAFIVMARLVRATCTTTLPRKVARTSPAMTVGQTRS